jgi:hypothetical protein
VSRFLVEQDGGCKFFVSLFPQEVKSHTALEWYTLMITAGLNLLISDKPDAEREAVADVFAHHGGMIHRIGRFWDPPLFDPATLRVYGCDPERVLPAIVAASGPKLTQHAHSIGSQ